MGYYFGGATAAQVIAGIGINLGSTIIQNGNIKLKQRWVDGRDGVHNHDIQQVLQRAVLKTLTRLEEGYFRRGQAHALPIHEQTSLHELFKELRSHVQDGFPGHVERTIQECQVGESLYAPPEIARDRLWERINGSGLLRTYDEDFRSFLRQSLLPEVQFCFGEELKTDSPACNRACRAFQRLLLEGIRDDVRAVQSQQEEIRKDLHILDGLKERLDALQGVLDRRLPDEPFQQALQQSVHDIGLLLQEVAGSTLRTEGKVDTVGADVREIKADVKRLLDVGESQPGIRSGVTEPRPVASVPAVTPYLTGREADVRRVLEQLRDVRLVTLTGLGGIGKSELAKEVGRQAQRQEWAADGVYYVDLQSATSVQAVTSTLGLYRALGDRYSVASTLWYLGRLHAAAERREDAFRGMAEAVLLFEELGLTPWATAVRVEAEALQQGRA